MKKNKARIEDERIHEELAQIGKEHLCAQMKSLVERLGRSAFQASSFKNFPHDEGSIYAGYAEAFIVNLAAYETTRAQLVRLKIPVQKYDAELQKRCELYARIPSTHEEPLTPEKVKDWFIDNTRYSALIGGSIQEE